MKKKIAKLLRSSAQKLDPEQSLKCTDGNLQRLEARSIINKNDLPAGLKAHETLKYIKAHVTRQLAATNMLQDAVKINEGLYNFEVSMDVYILAP